MRPGRTAIWREVVTERQRARIPVWLRVLARLKEILQRAVRNLQPDPWSGPRSSWWAVCTWRGRIKTDEARLPDGTVVTVQQVRTMETVPPLRCAGVDDSYARASDRSEYES